MTKLSFFQISFNEIALGLSIIFTPVSQVLLRLGSKNSSGMIGAVLNLKTFFGYTLFSIVVLLMIYAMQQIPLKTVMAWASLTYVLTPVAARLFLKDPMSERMLAGAGLIMLGIIIFSF